MRDTIKINLSVQQDRPLPEYDFKEDSELVVHLAIQFDWAWDFIDSFFWFTKPYLRSCPRDGIWSFDVAAQVTEALGWPPASLEILSHVRGWEPRQTSPPLTLSHNPT